MKLDIVYLYTKSDNSSFSLSKDMIIMINLLNKRTDRPLTLICMKYM